MFASYSTGHLHVKLYCTVQDWVRVPSLKHVRMPKRLKASTVLSLSAIPGICWSRGLETIPRRYDGPTVLLHNQISY